jgi:enoyl-CoA hydratase/carnithine racemase
MRAGVLVISLRRPEKRNAMNNAMAVDLLHALDQSADAGAVVITGDEKAFSAGADLAEGVGANPATGNGWFDTFDRLAELAVAVVGAIEGHCLGGGLELALCCDLRVASTTARIGSPEITFGHWPGGGATLRLPRIVGLARAKQLVMTGLPIDAETALAWGLVNDVVAPGAALAAALVLADALATREPTAIRVAKQLSEASLDGSMADGLQADRSMWLTFSETLPKP